MLLAWLLAAGCVCPYTIYIHMRVSFFFFLLTSDSTRAAARVGYPQSPPRAEIESRERERAFGISPDTLKRCLSILEKIQRSWSAIWYLVGGRWSDTSHFAFAFSGFFWKLEKVLTTKIRTKKTAPLAPNPTTQPSLLFLAACGERIP